MFRNSDSATLEMGDTIHECICMGSKRVLCAVEGKHIAYINHMHVNIEWSRNEKDLDKDNI